MESPALFSQFGITDAEERLIRLDPGYATASTASRVDAFLLPDALYFAEYNAESPAGPAYTQRLAELFDSLPVTTRFRAGRRVRFHRPIGPLLTALLDSYREWGGTANPPTTANTRRTSGWLFRKSSACRKIRSVSARFDPTAV